MSSDGDELLWQCSPGCDSSFATIFFAARRWAFRTSDAVGTYTWQILTDLDAIVIFTDKQTSSWWTSFEVKLVLPKAPACAHQGLLFILYLLCETMQHFYQCAKFRPVNNPRNFTAIRSHRDGLCSICGFRAQKRLGASFKACYLLFLLVAMVRWTWLGRAPTKRTSSVPNILV